MASDEMVLFAAKDGTISLPVHIEWESVWLTLHLRNIFKSGELEERATCKEFLQVQTGGKRETARQDNHCHRRIVRHHGRFPGRTVSPRPQRRH